METILIAKDGKIFKNLHYSTSTKEKRVKSLSSYLGCYVKIEDGIVFKTIFDLILKEKEFFDKVFAQELDNYSLSVFEKEWKKRGNPSYQEDFKIKYLEVQKIYDYFETNGIEEIETFTLISAVSVLDGKEIKYSITLVPVSELKKIEVKINDQVDIFAANREEDELEIFKIISAKTRITVYELIRSIIFEIAMYGSPEEKKEKTKEFLKNINSKSMIPSLQKRMQEVIQKEDYEEAAELKEIIKKLSDLNSPE